MLWLLLSCSGEGEKTMEEALSLSEPLSENEVRAGEILDSSALFGGTAAEGAIGDFKLYNNKAQFIIQSIRPSAYYIQQGGGLLDADVVRHDGSQGRDIIDEHTPMAGFGRILEPDSIEVLSDGADGLATVRVTGHGTGFELLAGAVENDNLVPNKNMEFQVDYRLAPNSSLLEIETTITWLDEPYSFQPANVILIGREVIEWWNPGGGLHGEANNQWYGALGRENEVALALFPSVDTFDSSVIQPLLADATPAMSGFDEMVDFDNGTVHTFSHYVGVGDDFATLTDEWYTKRGVATQELSGTVTAGNAFVPGARIHILDEEQVPATLAVANESGEWSATVPADVSANFQVTGRGQGLVFDLPVDAGWYSLYGDSSVQDSLQVSLLQPSDILSAKLAEGYGVAELNSNELIAPGLLTVSLSDDGPGVVLIERVDDDVDANTAWAPRRPSGKQIIGYVRDGEMQLPLEPGSYRAIVHRGPECEYVESLFEIGTEQVETLEASIECVELPSGVYSFDPHSHSSPSGDGRVSTVQRLMSHAAHGVDIHIATEHDHLADYAQLIEDLGLNEHLITWSGAEVSPPLRGHHNIYPVPPVDGAVNNGAVSWWAEWSTTEDLFSKMRAIVNNGIVQVNHPLGSGGLIGSAGYDLEQGTISKPNFWADDFDAMEVINDGYYQDYLLYYFDLLSRGHKVSAMSVSDSHTHASGVGINRTYVYSDSAEESALVDAMKSGSVVASVGPYVHVTNNDRVAAGQTFVGSQEIIVEVFHPTWMDVDRLELYENGTVVETVEYTSGSVSFAVEPSRDAHYAVAASGTFPMTPIYSNSPWAMSGAFFVDVEGDGWTPPLEPLQ